jgi:hypothetical protein
MSLVVEIRYYVTRAGVNVVDRWIRGLRNEPSEARVYANRTPAKWKSGRLEIAWWRIA